MIFKLLTNRYLENKLRFWAYLSLIFVIPAYTFGINDSTYISTHGGKDMFQLSASGKSTNLFIDSTDYQGVIRTLNDLKSDIGKVTGAEPTVVFNKVPSEKFVVITGTLGKSPVINQLIKEGKLDVKNIEGKWEAFIIQTIDNPMPGVEKALVVVGSDKRGTIYGIYDISESIGVSPWYWWADVPIEHKDALYVKPGIYSQSPTVKYRGIFLNDEAPALSGWVAEKYGTVKPSENPPIPKGVANYNSEFYSKIFELLLRMKGNYMWPAMWNNAFNEDDPKNAKMADEYGIVMGTSHQEPMLRAQKEWDRRYYKTLGAWDYYKYPDTLANFWREGIRRNKDYESIITMGLRGANDSEIKGSRKDNIAQIEKIVQRQQEIIRQEMDSDITKVPQSWCLYKEIMDYYNEGMTVPDNITLLWADDNWGNVRRLPNAEERKRSGGSGVYYHFDYHGGPRSYEWINTNPIAKVWDQMMLAKEYGADDIWIVNVGHFKGYELPMEYFMNLAWNTNKWTNNNIDEYTRLWATREFGPEYAEEITEILTKYTRYNGRRKPESLRPDTYSLVNYNEAENVVADYDDIAARAEALYKKIPEEKRDAFYEIVLFPTKVCSIVNELYLSVAKNNLYAKQDRASTNCMAQKTGELFQADTAMMNYYNDIYADGRWKHFMDQTHLGYTSWNPPRKNSLKHVKLEKVTVKNKADMGVAIEGSVQSWPGSDEAPVLPEFDIFSNRQHYFEIYNKGKKAFDYKITSSVPWLKLSKTQGSIMDEDLRVFVDLDEANLPKGNAEGTIKVAGAGKKVSIGIKLFNPGNINRETAKGFVESGGYVSIEAEHFANNVKNNDRKWIKIEDYGLTLSGMRATAPIDMASAVPGQDAPCLEYPVHFFSKDSAEITLVTSPILNFMPGRDIRLAVSFDDQDPQYVMVVPDDYVISYSNTDWDNTVLNQARHCKVKVKIPAAGDHTLKVWMIDPGVVVEKILIDTGGLKPSYLGPEESFHNL